MTMSSPSFSSKLDNFQSPMTEKCCWSVSMAPRALNVSSMRMAQQAELEENTNSKPDFAQWNEICIVADFPLHQHYCAIQASGKSIGIMLAEMKVWWFNISSLSLKQKIQLLDPSVVSNNTNPKGLFGSAVASV